MKNHGSVTSLGGKTFGSVLLAGLFWIGCQSGGDPIGSIPKVEAKKDAAVVPMVDSAILLPDVPPLEPPDVPIRVEPDLPTLPDPVCGDGLVFSISGEQCDDGNPIPGDGCSATCTLEENFACPTPGQPCVPTVECKDGKVTGQEQCDDRNLTAGDGCDPACKLEKGFACPTPGSRCQAAACGDGIQVGLETCDDGNAVPGDGCDATCRLEPGYICPTVATPCQKTVCGNGKKENDEACDDGNAKPWDGCSPTCEGEPVCKEGECTSVCGDGMILTVDKEACDDGNGRDGDGCTKTCTLEPGWKCTNVPALPGDTLRLPVVYRDFIAMPAVGEARHPNFQQEIPGGNVIKKGLVKTTLGPDGKPLFAGICATGTSCPYGGAQLTTQADFDEWYRDTAKSVRGDSFIPLAKVGQLYVYDAVTGLFPFGNPPLETVGWVAQLKELTSNSGGLPQNFGFTTELRYWFQLQGGEQLDFAGDDDVWVFLKGNLLIDLGGRHSRVTGSLAMTDAEITTRGLTKGRLYEIAFFHAERHTSESNFKLTLSGFSRTKTSCTSICGDGIVVGNEVCDDGPLNGTYGHCNLTCDGLGPHCGDAVVQSTDGETCDDGVNLTTYGLNGKAACAPGCKLSPFCGDGKVDSLFGELCDNKGTTTPDGCRPNCTYRKFCPDGIVQTEDGETCDDGNEISGDGCSSFCTIESVIP